MKALLCLSLLVLSFSAMAQEGGLDSSGRKSLPTNDPSPVTCTEAHSVFSRIEIAMAKLVKAKHVSGVGLPSGSSPITRGQVVNELDRLSRLYASHYTLKPRTQYCNEAAIKLPNDERTKAIRLIKLGFMEPVAVLAVGPKPDLTVDQLAEALGFFVERWADMTHLPSIKFTPGLMPGSSTPTPPAGSRGQAPSGASRPPTSK